MACMSAKPQELKNGATTNNSSEASKLTLFSLDSAHPGGKNILIKWFATQYLNLYTGKQKDLKGTLYTSPTLNPCPTRHESYLQS